MQLRLLADGDGGEHAAQAGVVRGEQDAPRERVDRRAADERVAVEVAVDGGEVAQVGEQHEQHGREVEVLGEARSGLGGTRARISGPRARAVRLGVAVGDRGEGREPGLHLREVLVPAGQVEVAERLLDGRVARHDHVPGLPVPAVGREPGGVEEAVQDVVGHRLAAGSRGRRRSCGGPRSDPCARHYDPGNGSKVVSTITKGTRACTTS